MFSVTGDTYTSEEGAALDYNPYVVALKPSAFHANADGAIPVTFGRSAHLIHRLRLPFDNLPWR
jgi:hypothetical protein